MRKKSTCGSKMTIGRITIGLKGCRGIMIAFFVARRKCRTYYDLREGNARDASRKITTLIIPIGRPVFLPVFKLLSYPSGSRFSESHRRRNCFRKGFFFSLSRPRAHLRLYSASSTKILSFYLTPKGRYSRPDISRVSHFQPPGARNIGASKGGWKRAQFAWGRTSTFFQPSPGTAG